MRVEKSMPSIIRGVSEQPVEHRAQGQMGAQDNLISDPVLGLVRRQGSVHQAELRLSGVTALNNSIRSIARTTREYSYTDVHRYSVLYRRAPTIAGFNVPVVQVYDHDTAQFLPTVLGGPTSILTALIDQGVSAITNVGRYVLIAASGFVPTYSLTSPWEATNRVGVIWVRTGLYRTQYSVETVQVNGGTLSTASYTTPYASYQGVLDTSDILTGDPDYTKKVTDRTSAYNTAVTQWIGTAAEQSTPQYISQQLLTAIGASADPTVGRYGPYIGYVGSSNVLAVRNVPDTVMLNVGDVVSSIDDLTPVHAIGKVVKVQPSQSNPESVFYMEASAKDPSITVSFGGKSWGDVLWTEGAGEVVQPIDVFCIGTVYNGSFYLASNPAELSVLTGLSVPSFEPNAVGDTSGIPVPVFLQNPINLLGVFQDRLLIGSRNVLFMSRPGEYFNWFRGSMLTVLDTDPITLTAEGSEDDVLRHAVQFDRSLIVFGDRRQYVVPGTSVLTPSTASCATLSAYTGVADASPVASGGLVFYGAYQQSTEVHQMQPGDFVGQPYTESVSQQLHTYLQGRPVEFKTSTTPNNVYLRTEGLTNGLYLYTYRDAGGRRLYDSWSRWTFSENLGVVCGVATLGADVTVFSIRANASGLYIVADEISLVNEVVRPYCDSQRSASSITGWAAAAVDTSVLVYADGDEFLVGAEYEDRAGLDDWPANPARFVIGWNQPAMVELTNPLMLDRNGEPRLQDRVVVTRYNVHLQESSGLRYTVSTRNGQVASYDVSERILNTPSAALGQQYVGAGEASVIVGYESRECYVRLYSKDWLPLNITGLYWAGRVFGR